MLNAVYEVLIKMGTTFVLKCRWGQFEQMQQIIRFSQCITMLNFCPVVILMILQPDLEVFAKLFNNTIKDKRKRSLTAKNTRLNDFQMISSGFESRGDA